MGTYRTNPREIQAVQFTGENWDEMNELCGRRKLSGIGRDALVFNPAGTYIPEFLHVDESVAAAELWDEYAGKWMPVAVGDWVVKLNHSFMVTKPETFAESYTKVGPTLAGYTDIAPECFTDGLSIFYEGEMYWRSCYSHVYTDDREVAHPCVLRMGHPTLIHRAWDGTTREGVMPQSMKVSAEMVTVASVWANGMVVEEIDPFDADKKIPAINVETKAGVLRAYEGDTIVKHDDGSFDVLKESMFARVQHLFTPIES